MTAAGAGPRVPRRRAARVVRATSASTGRSRRRPSPSCPSRASTGSRSRRWRARAGVAKTTVYRRFPTRDELIVGALERLNDDLPRRAAAGPGARPAASRCSAGIRRRPTASVRGRHPHAGGRRGHCGIRRWPTSSTSGCWRRAARCCRDVIADGIASGELRDDIDLDAVVPLLVGPMLYLGMWSGMRDRARA